MSTGKYSWPKGVQNFHRIGHLRPFQSHERCLSHFIVLVGRRKVGTLLSLLRDDFSWLRNDQGPAVPGRRVKTPGESSCWKNYHCRKCCSMRSKNWSMDSSRLSFPEEKSRATARCDITPGASYLASPTNLQFTHNKRLRLAVRFHSLQTPLNAHSALLGTSKWLCW